jgi:hypothetical protein
LVLDCPVPRSHPHSWHRLTFPSFHLFCQVFEAR